MNIEKIPAFDRETGALNAIVETPRGNRCKFAYEPDTGLFHLKKILPIGTALPFDFGFIPGTRAADGDPLDVLIISHENLFPGCLLQVRPLGVIKYDDGAGKKKVRNDRVVAVPLLENAPMKIKTLKDLDRHLVKELEHIFMYQHNLEGKRFECLGLAGPAKAVELVKKFKRRK